MLYLSMFTVDFEQVNAHWLNMETYFTYVPPPPAPAPTPRLCHENIRASNGFQIFPEVIIIEQCERMG